MEFDQALEFLDRHVNLEAKAGRVERLSLDRMRRLAGLLGDPQQAYPSVHITGTNGKGSISAMITALLRARGLSVGTYTSPHVESITERLRWNGEPIAPEAFGALFGELARLEPLLGDERPSYFELMTAAAFAWFADLAVDVAVVEVGLLGRYDATNVIDGDVAVVTNIGRDHTDGTGDWRRRIAEEKAGIIKPDSVLVLGETDPALRAVFLDERPARAVERDVHFAAVNDRLAVGGRVVDVRTDRRVYRDVFVPLHGAHQSLNASIAIAATEEFFATAIEDDVVDDAFAGVEMPGRFEIVSRDPLIVLDVAHNPEGAAAAAHTQRAEFGESRPTVLVIGLLQGREIEAMLDAFEARRADAVICCTADSPRAYPAAELAEVARRRGIDAEAVPSIADALDRARAVAPDDAVILVTGTVYIVGAARTLLRA